MKAKIFNSMSHNEKNWLGNTEPIKEIQEMKHSLTYTRQ